MRIFLSQPFLRLSRALVNELIKSSVDSGAFLLITSGSSSFCSEIFFNPAFLVPPAARIASIKSARPPFVGIGGDGIEAKIAEGGRGGGAGGIPSILLGGAIGGGGMFWGGMISLIVGAGGITEEEGPGKS
jgi:hypothetical protein